MNCKDAKSFIALWVGQDLDDSELEALQPHLAECRDCAAHWDEMKSSMNVLQQVSNEVLTKAVHRSLWPKVAASISSRKHTAHSTVQNTGRRRWAPAIAVCAACLAVAAFVNFESSLTNIYEVSHGVDPNQLPENFVEHFSDDSFKQLQDIDQPAPVQNEVDPSTIGVSRVSVGKF